MDLFQPLPMLRRQPLLRGKAVSLIGVSAIVSDDTAYYFEIAKPRYWRARPDGTTSIGIGAIGGSIGQSETLLSCLRREVREEIGARVSLEAPERTYLIRGPAGAAEEDWQVADAVEIAPSKKRPVPWMVILFPPRLGGAGTPDWLAICAFRTRLEGRAEPRDLFGLLSIGRPVLAQFFCWRRVDGGRFAGPARCGGLAHR